jgi:hypothetical protein
MLGDTSRGFVRLGGTHLGPLFLRVVRLGGTHLRRLFFREAYAWFVAAYREAAEKLRKGNLGARFPVGSFPPALPFVGG